LGRKLTVEDFFKIGLLQNPRKELKLRFSIRLVFDDAQEFLLTGQILGIQKVESLIKIFFIFP
jgi:hypothetical protein